MATLTSLPPEMVREILSYLPVRALLAFGLTSKENHAHQSVSLSKLRLGVFPSRLNGLISLMEASEDRSSVNSVQVTLPKSKSRTKDMVVRNQNATVEKVVTKYRLTLRDLEVAVWELTRSSVESIGRLRNLRRLSIRLDHPHTRHSDVDRSFWKSSPGSTIWNSLFRDSDLKSPRTYPLGRLESLSLERAGITDYQLQQTLVNNPRITELRLQKCLTLTREIFEYLANSHFGGTMKVLHFTQNDRTEIDDRVLVHIGRLSELKSLSFHGCSNIDSGRVKRMNDVEWHIPTLRLPYDAECSQQVVEVDPAYK